MRSLPSVLNPPPTPPPPLLPSPFPSLRASEHFPKPHRDTRAEPFDARCCRGYWIKVSRLAEEIISRAARTTKGCYPPQPPFPPVCAALVLLQEPPHGERASSTPEKKLTGAEPFPSPPHTPTPCALLSFGFSRLVVFLCRQNARRRHLALNIYGKVPSRNCAMAELSAAFLPAG